MCSHVSMGEECVVGECEGIHMGERVCMRAFTRVVCVCMRCVWWVGVRECTWMTVCACVCSQISVLACASVRGVCGA